MSFQDVETEDGEEDLFGWEREREVENGSPKKALRIDHAMYLPPRKQTSPRASQVFPFVSIAFYFLCFVWVV